MVLCKITSIGIRYNSFTVIAQITKTFNSFVCHRVTSWFYLFIYLFIYYLLSIHAFFFLGLKIFNFHLEWNWHKTLKTKEVHISPNVSRHTQQQTSWAGQSSSETENQENCFCMTLALCSGAFYVKHEMTNIKLLTPQKPVLQLRFPNAKSVIALLAVNCAMLVYINSKYKCMAGFGWERFFSCYCTFFTVSRNNSKTREKLAAAAPKLSWNKDSPYD